MNIVQRALLLAYLVIFGAVEGLAGPPTTPPEGVGQRTFALAQPVPKVPGGLFAHDLDGDKRLDFVVTSEGHIGAYANSGKVMWVRSVEIRLFEYPRHPSVIAGDLDGDGYDEIAYLSVDNTIVILDGRTGEDKRTLSNIGKPVALAIANLRGLGDRDILLQDSQTKIRAIRAEDGGLLWETDEYRGIEHSPLRQADLDGDGRDEVAGASLIDDDGRLMNEWDLGDDYLSMDSMVIADIVPGLPLEIALAEQRGDRSHTTVVAPDRILWRALNPWNWEDPDKLAVGDFDPGRPGLEVFNRSSGGDGTAPRSREEPYANEEAPWVLDAQGNLITKYYINDHKPEWWTGHGLEEVCRIDWDGSGRDLIAGKERHIEGACAVVDPLSGRFIVVIPAHAARLYVADVQADAREELVVINTDGSVSIYWNAKPSIRPEQPSPWTIQHYRRQKQNWNYYSP